jgi:radical SAM-linked protein
MEGAVEIEVSPPGERFRWMLVFTLGGDLRFISHHDTLRLFRRALARADIPVRYSEGFNPHPKIMIPLPRPVGIASRDEALVLETNRIIDPDQALQRLQEQTPNDIEVISLRRMERGEQMEPQCVRYRLDLSDMNIDDLDTRVEKMMTAETIPIERKSPKSKDARLVDIRPYLLNLRATGQAVEFTLKVTGNGTAKPAEIAGVLGCDAGSINHRIERLEVQWKPTPQRT